MYVCVLHVWLYTSLSYSPRSATNKHDIPLSPVVTLREEICVTFIHLHPSLSHGSKPSLRSQNFRLQPLFQRQNWKYKSWNQKGVKPLVRLIGKKNFVISGFERVSLEIPRLQFLQDLVIKNEPWTILVWHLLPVYPSLHLQLLGFIQVPSAQPSPSKSQIARKSCDHKISAG